MDGVRPSSPYRVVVVLLFCDNDKKIVIIFGGASFSVVNFDSVKDYVIWVLSEC